VGQPVVERFREVIRAPAGVRAFGVYMLAVVVVGSVVFVAVAASGDSGALVGLVLWSLPAGYYATRLMRLSVVADDLGVVVHNRYRSRELCWSDIESISFEKRRGPWWYPLVMIWGRWVGVIRLRDGTDVEVHAFESFWANWSGRLFSGSKRSCELRTERLRAVRARFDAA
jgi:hypothetical protein